VEMTEIFRLLFDDLCQGVKSLTMNGDHPLMMH
jgi:hypothetical protein